VLRSTVLVCLNPVWTGLLEWLLSGSRPRPTYFLGVGLSVVGAALMAGGGGEGASSLTGDGLALIGGVLAAGYLVVGRTVRQRVGIGPYGALLCASAALWLLPAVLVVGADLIGFPREVWWALLALALGPQLLGHIGFNFAMRTVSAATVATVILLEPVGASLLAALAFGEWPGWRELSGGAVVLLGVLVASRR
jgi:drug/metabolite transporter (DMT)-like permease